ncbi:MAG: hypothetical protein QNJ97_13905 [Myxococcota bacterium]|nr:hypothetical protein [Myxococcota bacterium]
MKSIASLAGVFGAFIFLLMLSPVFFYCNKSEAEPSEASSVTSEGKEQSRTKKGGTSKMTQLAPMGRNAKILFLHHSTGGNILNGGLMQWLRSYNATNGTAYRFENAKFPKASPYGWHNYPFDYWNIWVNHAGNRPYKEEPTLEMLTRENDVIVWKHCYPVSRIEKDTGSPKISSDRKSIENYKLQYNALKKKMHTFPKVRFLVWTGAALVKGQTQKHQAKNAKAFFDWVRNKWDEPCDNIFLWDFWELETEGGMYMKDAYAVSPRDSHPNPQFSAKVAPLFGRRIVDVIQGKDKRCGG